MNDQIDEVDIYSDTGPIAFRTDGQTYFEHLHWVRSERLYTSYNGRDAATLAALPFGDSESMTGTVWDQHDFGLLDYAGEDGTEHAQFRQYSPNQGRWLTTDPYYGSYDISNPQSFNRYAYVLNDPVSLRDPSGLDCAYSNDDGTVTVSAGDCDETIADGNGYYVDCDGCLLNASANLDLTTGTLTFTSADGTLYTIDDYADPLGTSTTVNVNGSNGVNYSLGYGISGIQVTGLIALNKPSQPTLQPEKEPYWKCVGKTTFEDAAWGAAGTAAIAVAAPVAGGALGFAVGVAIAPVAAVGSLALGIPVGLIHGLVGCAF